MANIDLLKKKMSDSGMSTTFIAKKVGISRETLYNRLEKPDFRASEIVLLTKVLRLSRSERDSIFF